MANSTQLIYEIQVDSGNSVKTLNSIEQELAQINSELKDAEINSDAFNKLAAQSKLLEGELERVNNTVSNLEFSDKLMAADGAIKVATGTLQSFIGSVVLFGDESNPALEEFEKKAIGAISTAQGLKDLSEGFGQIAQVVTKLPKPINLATKAQAAFNFVLNANPVGLIITAITVVVGLFITFNKRIRETIANFEPLNKVLSQAVGLFKQIGQAIGLVESEQEKLARATRELAEKRASDLEFELKLLQARGKRTVEVERELLQQRIKATEEFSDERKKAVRDLRLFEARTEQQYLEEKEKAIQQDLEEEKRRNEKLKQLAQERIAAIQEIEQASISTEAQQFAFDLKEVEKQYDELIKLARKYGQSTEALEIARQIKLERIRKEYNDKLSEEEAAKIELLDNLNEELFNLQAQYIADEEELIRIGEANKRKELEDSFNELRDKTTEFYNEQYAAAVGDSERQLELIRERDNQINLIEQERLIARLGLEDKLIKEQNEIKKANAREIESTLEKIRIDSIQNVFEKQLELLEQERDNEIERLKRIGATEEQITQIKQFYADKQNEIEAKKIAADLALEEAKREQILIATGQLFGNITSLLGEQTKAGKAFAIADALISTYLGVAKSLANPGGILGIIQAATVLTTGLANVAKIKSINVESPSTSAGGSGVSIPRPNLRDPSDFATIQTPNITQPPNQLQQQLDIQSGGGRIGGGVRTEPIRAYVVAGSVRDGLEADAKIRQRRTVGRLKPE